MLNESHLRPTQASPTRAVESASPLSTPPAGLAQRASALDSLKQLPARPARGNRFYEADFGEPQ
jgi:hypothetical protein